MRLTRPRQSSTIRSLAGLCAFALVVAACGGDDDSPEAETPAETTAAPIEDDTGDDSEVDGGVIAYLVAGDRNDGGFYQGQVDAVLEAAEAAGFEVVVVDRVAPGGAREAFENVARQGPDLVIAGGSELSDGLVPVASAPEFADTTFVMVAGYPATSGDYATVGANEDEAHFMGGVAMGLLLERSGSDTACIVGGPELPFVLNMAASIEAGLAHLNPDLNLLVTFTGDFEDAALAQEAATAQINQGCTVIYPYLGGALGTVVLTGNEAGIDVVATSVDRCDDPTADFGMAILYNPALFLPEVIEAFQQGRIVEGEQFALYGVGSGLGVGARICDATAEEQETLDDVREAVASGEISGWLG